MKIKTTFFAVLATLVISSCKKKEDPIGTASPTNTYSSVQDFFNRNGVQKQIYSIDASIGGMFITPKGTKVTIPANAFVTQSGGPVTGAVTIEFKDIYSKSDMLLSNIPSMDYNSRPLKSAGEFYIIAKVGSAAVLLNTGKSITVEQPNPSGIIDTAMTPFVAVPDSVMLGISWWPTTYDSVSSNAADYVFSLYSFNMPVDSGTWCNSDNSFYFSSYTQTPLSISANDDPAIYSQQVFLVFSSVNSMVHVYQTTASDFNYGYAPIGLQCTVVAIGSKDGKLYSSFTPITISSGQTVHFSLTETTDVAFKAQLNALN